jgi:hypothetical protein
MARFVLIFTILIGLGAAFLGWKTKEQAETLQGSLKQSRQDLATAKTTLKKTETELGTTKATLTETEGKLTQTQTELTNAKGEAANAKEALAKVEAAAKENADKVADIQAQFAALKEKIGDIKLEEIGPKIKELTETRTRLETELAEAKQVGEGLKKQKDEIEATVAAKDRTIAEYKQGFVKNALTGRVLAFNPGWNFVVMNLGDKQGIKVGAQMVVTRAGAMVGKVKVTSVEPSQSIGDVLPGTVARGETVQPGDTVVFEGSRR